MSYSFVPADDSVQLVDDVQIQQDHISIPRLIGKERRGRCLLLGGTASVLVGMVVLITVGVIFGVRHKNSGDKGQSHANTYKCGISLLPASTRICGKLLDHSHKFNDTEKCLMYKAFLTCSAIYLSTFSMEWNQCEFETLHQNILTLKSVPGNISATCGNSTSRFDDLDRNFAGPLTRFCANSNIYQFFLKYVCIDSGVNFTGHELGDKCLSMFSRVLCLKTIFHKARLNCTDGMIENISTAVLQNGTHANVSLKLFCEQNYPCVLRELKQVEGDTVLGSCVHGALRFLSLSNLGVDINNKLALGSEAEKLKCRVWSVLTSCALFSASVHCQQFVDQVQMGLQILANQESASTDVNTVTVGIFNDCPAYSRVVSSCPVEHELVYSSVAYCSFPAMKQYQENGTTEKACRSIGQCEHSIKLGYSDCQNIDDYFKDLQANNTQAYRYMRNITGFDCG